MDHGWATNAMNLSPPIILSKKTFHFEIPKATMGPPFCLYAIALFLLVAEFPAGTTALALPLKSAGKDVVISPSVAKADLLNLEHDLDAAVKGGAEWLHFSVQDGRMVPKISFGAPIVSACRKAFPMTIFDVKLGCIEPEHRVDDFVKAGADIISVHPESTVQLSAVINKIQAAGVAPGVVLNPGTSVGAVEHVLDQCQVVVVMLVNPGYGGPKYLKQAIEKIRQLRQMKPDLFISVDGGVNLDNAPALIEAGANVLVAGGGIFKADDKEAAIRALKTCGIAGENHMDSFASKPPL